MNSLLLKKRPLVLKPKNSSTDKTNSMETYKFKTNINCNGCIAAVTPKLEALPEIKTWNVDIDNPDKILTVELDNSNSTKIKDAVESAGFSITQV